MPYFLDTRGNTSVAIAVCARCGIKMPIGELMPDPNFPGLRVCRDDLDDLDPWRLPAREVERIDLEYPRPDLSVATFYPKPVYANQLTPVIEGTQAQPLGATQTAAIAAAPAVTQQLPNVVWAPSTVTGVGQLMTVVNPDPAAAVTANAGTLPGQTADPILPVPQWLCVIGGVTSAALPAALANLTATEGVAVVDGGVIWLCQGWYLI